MLSKYVTVFPNVKPRLAGEVFSWLVSAVVGLWLIIIFQRTLSSRAALGCRSFFWPANSERDAQLCTDKIPQLPSVLRNVFGFVDSDVLGLELLPEGTV